MEIFGNMSKEQFINNLLRLWKLTKFESFGEFESFIWDEIPPMDMADYSNEDLIKIASNVIDSEYCAHQLKNGIGILSDDDRQYIGVMKQARRREIASNILEKYFTGHNFEALDIVKALEEAYDAGVEASEMNG